MNMSDNSINILKQMREGVEKEFYTILFKE